jgi:hypothetical protein
MIWLWLIRFLRGERFRKATNEESRIGSALFVSVPLFIVGGAQVESHFGSFFGQASGVVLWVCAMVAMVFLLLVVLLLAKYVPARFSYLAGAVIWPIAVWIAWHFGMHSS